MSNYTLCIGKQFNYLKSMTFEEQEALHKGSASINVAKGDVIFYEEEKLYKLFCISKGAYKFSLVDDNGKEHITKLLGKGDIMGRHSIISNNGALVTATAITDSVLYSFDKNTVLEAMNKNSAFCRDVLKGFVSDMAEETEKIKYFKNYRSVKKRLAGLLLYLSKKFGEDEEGWINISLKRQDFANILGTTSEYIISLLSVFKQKKLLKIDREKIKILSSKELNIMLK